MPGKSDEEEAVVAVTRWKHDGSAVVVAEGEERGPMLRLVRPGEALPPRRPRGPRQSALDQARRLRDGRCPVHGTALRGWSQAWGSPGGMDRFVDDEGCTILVVHCPRRACGRRFFGYDGDHGIVDCFPFADGDERRYSMWRSPWREHLLPDEWLQQLPRRLRPVPPSWWADMNSGRSSG